MEYSFPAINLRVRPLPDSGIYLMFFVWPFAGLILAFMNIRSIVARNVFWLYTIFYGFTFVISDANADATRYRDALVLMSGQDFSLNTLFRSYLDPDSGTLDIVQRLITFIVSRFTVDYRFLFSTFGLFLGFFLSRMIWFIFNKSSRHLSLFESLTLISFSLVVGIWDIGGIRFILAMVVYVYGVLIFLLDQNKSGLVLASTSIFIHWSFSMALVVLLAYLLAKNRTKIYFGIFVFSFLLSEINIDFIRNIFNSYAPAAVRQSRGSYLNELYIQGLEEGTSAIAWYVRGHVYLIRMYFLLIIGYLIIWNFERIKDNKTLLNLFSFSILFYGIFNTLSTIPSMLRFVEVGNMFLLASVFIIFTVDKNSLPSVFRLTGILVFLIFLIVRFRFGFDYIGAGSIFGSPLYIYFADNTTPIIDFVKGLL